MVIETNDERERERGREREREREFLQSVQVDDENDDYVLINP